MRIALLLDEKGRQRLFAPDSLQALAGLAELSLNRGAAGDPASILEAIDGADVAISSWGSPPVTEVELAAAPALRLLIHAAGSVKPVVSPALWARGVRVCSAAEALGRGVADTALGFTIAALKDLFDLSRRFHAGEAWPDRGRVRELYRLRVLVVGAGYAGRHYLKLLSNFEVERLVVDPFVDPATLDDDVRVGTLEELLPLADVVSLHAPSLPSTRHMISAERLALMRDDAILINTARGSLIDEAALYRHIRAGKLRYACLDVFDPEPLPADSPLRTLPNVILSPHLAGLCNNGLLRIGDYCLEILRQWTRDPEARLPGELLEADLARMA